MFSFRSPMARCPHREQKFVMEDLADSGHRGTGHFHAAPGVAQEGDRLDGARGRRESEGDRDEGAVAGRGDDSLAVPFPNRARRALFHFFLKPCSKKGIDVAKIMALEN
jgi:hypothetical protein